MVFLICLLWRHGDNCRPLAGSDLIKKQSSHLHNSNPPFRFQTSGHKKPNPGPESPLPPEATRRETIRLPTKPTQPLHQPPLPRSYAGRLASSLLFHLDCPLSLLLYFPPERAAAFAAVTTAPDRKISSSRPGLWAAADQNSTRIPSTRPCRAKRPMFVPSWSSLAVSLALFIFPSFLHSWMMMVVVVGRRNL